MNEQWLRQQIASLTARVATLEKDLTIVWDAVGRLVPDTHTDARIDAIEAAVDEVMAETGTGPVEGDAEAPAAPSVPRRAKEKAK